MNKKTMIKVILIFAIGIVCALFIREMILQNKKDTSLQLPGEDMPFTETEIEEQKYSGKIVVIDAGHGGVDPGKVGVNGAEEKDINLEIALFLKEMLEEDGVTVVMTRQNDSGLYDENSSNKKMQDLRGRLAIIDESRADLVVSVHQNSFSDSSVRGPQVFYYETSEEGALAAKCLQEAMNTQLEIAKPRVQKGNDNYYLLTKCAATMVIAECGFLSNPEEEKLLKDATYQEKVATAIKQGIYDYFDAKAEVVSEPQI